MPKPLPCARMKPQLFWSRAISPADSAAGVNAVSVTAYVPAAAELLACRVVPHATIPCTGVALAIAPAEFAQLPPTGAVATSLITIDVGVPRVSGLLIKSRCADSETKPFGVTGQEQQETISSSGA